MWRADAVCLFFSCFFQYKHYFSTVSSHRVCLQLFLSGIVISCIFSSTGGMVCRLTVLSCLHEMLSILPVERKWDYLALVVLDKERDMLLFYHEMETKQHDSE